MAIPLTFIKCSGAGNDFVLIDNMDNSLSVEQPPLAVALCSRPFGVGADGLLVLEESSRADFAMKYYNADGSYGGMCGNGGRCIAMYAYRKGYAGRTMKFEALDFLYEAQIVKSGVGLRMKDPAGFRRDLRLPVPGGTVEAHFIDTGSPHLIMPVSDLDRVEVQELGRKLRFHQQVAPSGANVNFVAFQDRNRIRIRTYERGVEGETLACGTGSVASAVVSALLGKAAAPVLVEVRSGESLKVSFTVEGENAREVTLEGSAHILFRGRALYDPVSTDLRLAVDSL